MIAPSQIASTYNCCEYLMKRCSVCPLFVGTDFSMKISCPSTRVLGDSSVCPCVCRHNSIKHTANSPKLPTLGLPIILSLLTLSVLSSFTCCMVFWALRNFVLIWETSAYKGVWGLGFGVWG